MQAKVYGVIVTPSRTKVSGGLTAGMQLSRAIAFETAYEVLVMADIASIEVENDGLKILKFACGSFLDRFAKFVPNSLLTIFEYSPDLISYIIKSKPQLVHIHNPHPAPALWKVASACRRNHIPYVLSSHGFNEFANPNAWFSRNPIKLWLFRHVIERPFRRAVDNAAAVFLTSPPESRVADALRIPQEKRHIVTNGYDQFYCERPEESDINRVKQRFNLQPSDLPVYLFLGNHTANKGLDTLLEACHLTRLPCKLVVGGAIRSQLEHSKLLNAHNFEKIKYKVCFTDYLTREDLRALYYAVDAFVFPSKADTLPLVVIDAMATGLPVIASDVGGVSYQVDSSTGRLIRPGDAYALAMAIDELSSSKSLRLKLGNAGRERALERFSWQGSARQAIRIYEEIVSSYHSQR